MKRFLYVMIGVALLLTSCDKEDMDNGCLDGFWQLTEMTNKSDASTSDMRSSGITWAFQGDILELRDVKRVHQDIVMSFSRESDRLKVYAPYLVDRDSDDIELTDVLLIEPYGISQLNTEFHISELSGNRMVLDDDVWHLVFRKY